MCLLWLTHFQFSSNWVWFFFFRFEESKWNFNFPITASDHMTKFDQQSPQEEKDFLSGVIFVCYLSRPEVLFASFFILSPGSFFFFFSLSHNSRKIFCSLSGQQEAKLKTNNFWISTARQSECWLRSEKERKKEKSGGKDPKGRKGQLRDLEGSGSGGARLPRLMWEVWAQPAGMLSGTSH